MCIILNMNERDGDEIDEIEDEQDDEEEEYIVEAIRSWRYHARSKRREYRIKWNGYPEDQNTWEPEENLHCPDILSEFKANMPEAEKIYFNSRNLDLLTGFQRNAEFRRVIGVDGPHDSDEEDSEKQEPQRFYVLVLFEDSDAAEEVTLKELFEYRPSEAFEFCEQRMLRKRSKENSFVNHG